jgi:threonine synthase
MKLIRGSGIVSDRVSEQDCHQTILDMHRATGIIIDPHSAVAMTAAMRFKEDGIPMVVMETAQPCKFDETIRDVLGESASRPKPFEGIEDTLQFFEEMDPDPEKVKDLIRAYA